jgi:hypothetical protein
VLSTRAEAQDSRKEVERELSSQLEAERWGKAELASNLADAQEGMEAFRSTAADLKVELERVRGGQADSERLAAEVNLPQTLNLEP